MTRSNVIDLNNPDTRREVLLERLRMSGRLIAGDLAEEFGVSGGTVRRDLLALEHEGQLRRIRGGALPPAVPGKPYLQRSASAGSELEPLARCSLKLVKRGMCLLLDGGTTIVACAGAMPSELRLTIVTPSPAVALAAHANNHQVILIGGRLSEYGGVAVGANAEREIDRCAADLCLLGACGLNDQYGLGADDHDEASLKRSMISSAGRSAVVTSADKIGRRSRHRVAAVSEMDILVTDASTDALGGFELAGLEVLCA